jgi:hypothetical protein
MKVRQERLHKTGLIKHLLKHILYCVCTFLTTLLAAITINSAGETYKLTLYHQLKKHQVVESDVIRKVGEKGIHYW